MQKLKFKINGKSYEAVVSEKEHNVASIELNGKAYIVEVEKEEAVASPLIAKPKRSKKSAAAETFVEPTVEMGNAGSIKAPLPGNVAKVKVQEGAKVNAGNVLIVLEAMKMENEILAPAAGTVKKLYVQEGKAVQQGEALVDLE